MKFSDFFTFYSGSLAIWLAVGGFLYFSLESHEKYAALISDFVNYNDNTLIPNTQKFLGVSIRLSDSIFGHSLFSFRSFMASVIISTNIFIIAYAVAYVTSPPDVRFDMPIFQSAPLSASLISTIVGDKGTQEIIKSRDLLFYVGNTMTILLMFAAEFIIVVKTRILLKLAARSLLIKIMSIAVVMDILSSVAIFVALLPLAQTITLFSVDFLAINYSSLRPVAITTNRIFTRDPNEQILFLTREGINIFHSKSAYKENVVSVVPILIQLMEKIDPLFQAHYKESDGNVHSIMYYRKALFAKTYFSALGHTVLLIEDEMKSRISAFETFGVVGIYVGTHKFSCQVQTHGAIFKAKIDEEIQDEESRDDLCLPGVVTSAIKLPFSTMLFGSIATNFWLLLVMLSVLCLRVLTSHGFVAKAFLVGLKEKRGGVLFYGVWLPAILFVLTLVIGIIFF